VSDEDSAFPPSEPDWAAFGHGAATAREEWRAEQESLAEDAAQARHHGRRLGDVLVDALRNGDRVAVSVGGHHLVGFVVDVSDDLLALRTIAGSRNDVRLDPHVAISVSLRDRAAGQPRTGEIERRTFRSRLLEHEAARTELVVASTLSPDLLEGRVAAAADHVRVVGRANETLLSLAALVYVAPRAAA
jgi:hypothetical protein